MLFQQGNFRLASGAESWFKIECDCLTPDDWATVARLIAERVPPFGSVEGVPRGGLMLADMLLPYVTEGPLVVCDDVFSTGGSMRRHLNGRTAIGAVLFARGPTPPWIMPLFTMSPTLAH